MKGIKPYKWLLVSLDVGELGTWHFDTRKEAIGKRDALVKEGLDAENIQFFYGKIHESKLGMG